VTKTHRGAYLKKEANKKNVQARLNWLLSGIANPKIVTIAEQKSLHSQRRFSELAVGGTNIQPISLNTLKNIANELLAEKSSCASGFDYIDNLRSELKSLVSKRTKAAKISRSEAKASRFNSHLYQVELLNLQRSKAYFDLFQRVVSICNDVSLTDAIRFRLSSLVEDHRALYFDLTAPQEIVGQSRLRVVAGKEHGV
jgi:hypothetical protein